MPYISKNNKFNQAERIWESKYKTKIIELKELHQEKETSEVIKASTSMAKTKTECSWQRLADNTITYEFRRRDSGNNKRRTLFKTKQK